MARIAVGIAAGERGHAHFSRRDECAPVADRASLRHVANQTDPRFPSHCRLEQVLKFRKRRNSVEEDARAHDLKSRVVESERARALQNMRFGIARYRCAKLLNHFSKTN